MNKFFAVAGFGAAHTIIDGRFNTDLRAQSGPLVNLTSSHGVGAELSPAHGPLIA